MSSKSEKDGRSVRMINSSEDITSDLNEDESSDNGSFSVENFVINVVNSEEKQNLNQDLVKVSSIDDKTEPNESVSQKNKNKEANLKIDDFDAKLITESIPNKYSQVHKPIQRQNRNFLANFEQNLK